MNDGRWVDENHGDFYARNKDGCKACHGPNLLGTVLAAMPIGRTFSVEGRQISYAKGELVACNRCHGRPSL